MHRTHKNETKTHTGVTVNDKIGQNLFLAPLLLLGGSDISQPTSAPELDWEFPIIPIALNNTDHAVQKRTTAGNQLMREIGLNLWLTHSCQHPNNRVRGRGEGGRGDAIVSHSSSLNNKQTKNKKIIQRLLAIARSNGHRTSRTLERRTQLQARGSAPTGRAQAKDGGLLPCALRER